MDVLPITKVVFTSFCLQPPELNDVFSSVKHIFSDFLVGKIGGRLLFGLVRYEALHVIFYSLVLPPLSDTACVYPSVRMA
jgi:hypothetical protein